MANCLAVLFRLARRISRRFCAPSFHPPYPPGYKRSCRWLLGRMCHQGSCFSFIKHLLCRWPRHSNFDGWLILWAQGHHGHAVIALDRPLNVEAASRGRHDRNKRRNGCVVCWEQGRHSRSEKESKAPQIGRDDSVNAEMCSERILPPI